MDGRRRDFICSTVMTMDREWQLLSPREYDCELVKIDEEWLFIIGTVLRMDRMFSIP